MPGYVYSVIDTSLCLIDTIHALTFDSLGGGGSLYRYMMIKWMVV